MTNTRFLLLMLLVWSMNSVAQDSTIIIENKVVTLKEVVVRNNLNVAQFIKRIQDDSSFYKAFKNLRLVGYRANNDIRMLDKKGNQLATYQSKSTQMVANGCRWMQTREENSTGNMLNASGEWNYYTAELYAGLFLTKDTICGETNIVGDTDFAIKGKRGVEKHKEQLKMLFFNPGKRIPGLPFMGNKVALFDEDVADLYNFEIDIDTYNGEQVYVFYVKPRTDLTSGQQNKLVVNDMTTWFKMDNWDIVSRRYDLSYNAGIYDFDVHIHVDLESHMGLLFPATMRYNGNWKVAFKKREWGIFTARLTNFTR